MTQRAGVSEKENQEYEEEVKKGIKEEKGNGTFRNITPTTYRKKHLKTF